MNYIQPTIYTLTDYLESKTSLQERIAAIDVLIDRMILTIGEAITGSAASVSEYSLDDGQIKIKTAYRSVPDIQEGIRGLETMRNLYINRMTGRQTILRDYKSIR